jgi:hypothetical protein
MQNGANASGHSFLSCSGANMFRSSSGPTDIQSVDFLGSGAGGQKPVIHKCDIYLSIGERIDHPAKVL